MNYIPYLNQLKFNPLKLYNSKEIAKMKFGKAQIGTGGLVKIRHVKSPIYGLKIKQQSFNKVLQKISLPNSMFGSISKRNNILNALAHIQSKYFLKVDLKNFFSNINNRQVHQTLLKYGFSWHEARIITRISTVDGNLPQGAPTSPILANLVLSFTAMELEQFCKEKDIIFTCYLDDLTFSCKVQFNIFYAEILDIIKKGGFYLNHKKIQSRKNICEVTGLIIKDGQLHLEEEMKKRLNNPGVYAYSKLIKLLFNEYKNNTKLI